MFKEILGVVLQSTKESVSLKVDDRVVLRDCVLVKVLMEKASVLSPSVAVGHDREAPVRVCPTRTQRVVRTCCVGCMGRWDRYKWATGISGRSE